MIKKTVLIIIGALAVIAVLALIINLCPPLENWLHDVTGWH